MSAKRKVRMTLTLVAEMSEADCAFVKENEGDAFEMLITSESANFLVEDVTTAVPDVPIDVSWIQSTEESEGD